MIADRIFDDVLDYIARDMQKEHVCVDDYGQGRLYVCLWKKGQECIEAGFSPASLRAAVECEKDKLTRQASDEELLELNLMLQVIYCMHAGDVGEIATLVQNFTSENIRVKYAATLEKMWEQNRRWEQEHNAENGQKTATLNLEVTADI